MAHEFSDPTTIPSTLDDPSVETVEMDTLETLATLDEIESLDDPDDPRALYTQKATEDVQWVMSSELIEPLEEADVLELDYDEEMPTRVDGRRRQDLHDSDFSIANDRPSLVLVDDERVDIGDVLRTVASVPHGILPEVVPPPRRTIPPPAPRMSSIAPVAIPTDDDEEHLSEPQSPIARPVSRRGLYTASIGALAVAAATIAVWPSQGVPTGMEPARITAVAQTPLVAHAVAEPVVHQLDVVMILGGAQEGTASAQPEPEALASKPASPLRAAPAWKPSEEVLIDDSKQLTEGVVFPSEPLHEAGEPPEGTRDTAPAPPAPPQDDPLPPFEASSASAALGAAAAAAQSCRAPGTGRFPARVSVTFAPSGRVTTATVDGPQVSGTPTGSCVATKFRSIRVNPFSGPAVTVHKTFDF